jgi:hypothetical protein
VFFKRALSWFFGGPAVSSRQSADDVAASYHRLADSSDARAKALHIDPPRPGRKTYTERYRETSNMSMSEVDAKIAEREAKGQECGVLYRVKADKLSEY